ncbi:MAG: Fe-S protein assembly co-chaperone HscB [Planctomycetia bacterium]|nr:Fe-S protein assembly co-chaperone HscB [Planctomycetia bacterium]
MTDHFHRLGLPRRFALDADELERVYLARSRAIHPDYHVAGSAADLSASLELSAAVNEAYNTLRDPFARAEHLLALEGGPTASEHKQIPQAFLAEMLDAREQIEATRGVPGELEKLEREFKTRFDGILTEVGKLFDSLGALPPDDPQRANLLLLIRGLLNAAKYVRGLLRDLHAD